MGYSSLEMREALATSHREASASVRKGIFANVPPFLKRLVTVAGVLVLATIFGHAVITPP